MLTCYFSAFRPIFNPGFHDVHVAVANFRYCFFVLFVDKIRFSSLIVFEVFKPRVIGRAF